MLLRSTVRLLNRLRLSAKFALLGLIGAIPMSALLVLVMREISDDLDFARGERAGARLIAPMARLLDAVQGGRLAER